MPTVAVESIGAGGGSIAWIDLAGALKVGPQSAGAEPGPACYGQGGKDATVTDANLLLGYLNPSAVLGGRISLNWRQSEEALRSISNRLGFGLRQMAEGMVEVANANMIRALRVVSVQKGFDVRKFTLIAFGGAGPVHAGRLAQELNIPRVVVPAYSSVFSAFGCLVSDLRYDAVQTRITRLLELGSGQLRALFAQLVAEMERRLVGEGFARHEIIWRCSLDARYVGQKYELEVPLPPYNEAIDLDQIHRDFRRIHEMSYSYSLDEEVECVNLRVSAILPTNHLDLPLLRRRPDVGAKKGQRLTYFREIGEIRTSVYDRTLLGVEQRVLGPAIIEDEWSTTVVYPGQAVVVDQYGNLILEVSA
jgi:N-methylhydantoinase A